MVHELTPVNVKDKNSISLKIAFSTSDNKMRYKKNSSISACQVSSKFVKRFKTRMQMIHSGLQALKINHTKPE
jgi:hypothetical protein